MAEKKFRDSALYTYYVYSAPAVRLSMLNGIFQGTSTAPFADANHRVGNKISVAGIWFQIEIRPGDDLTTPVPIPPGGGTCRILIFKNNDIGIGTIPVASDLLVSGDINDLRSTATLPAYKVIKDFKHVMSASSAISSTAVYTQSTTQANFYVPINEVFNYDGNTSDQAAVNYNGAPGVGLPGTAQFGYDVVATNLIKKDIQLIMFSDIPNCCKVKLRWKVVFRDT